MPFESRKNKEKEERDVLYKKGKNLIHQIKKMFYILSVQKRVSVCLPKRFWGSMTVEAAFVLPFFLFAFLNIISILELYRLQSNVGAAMHMTSKEMAVCGYEYKEGSDKDVGKMESLGLTYGYAANRVRMILGKQYLDNSPIKDGVSGIDWYRSSVLETDDCIDLIAVYTIKPPVAVVGFGEFKMYNRVLTRAWTGYDNAAASGSNTDDEMVYITPDGTVYHRSRACSYLKLSIVPVDWKILESERNEGGAKYYPCEECGKDERNVVYVTDYGTRYHSSLQCSKLKRTILAVPLSQVGGRGACSKCGAIH